ncbi:AsmA family protein [Endozoicomonas arenosclerae]|uniref:AsmA family protein n=1 Tax=Endozoicomonas arenosclerae TaxID=1633495 RepID=UPI0007840904|nr:AsmA family protein [Endozoicomonas arenosclerae]
MNRLIKLIAFVVAGIIVLAVAAALILPKVIDPNNYRDDISKLVYDNTGLTLTIDGPIGWSVFPWLGLSLEQVNVKGANNSELAKLGTAEVSVKLLPLLSKKVEMQTAKLMGLELNLVKDKSGKGNWEVPKKAGTQPAATETTPVETPEGTTESAPLELDIANVTVEGLVIKYDDKSTGKTYVVDQAGLETGAVRNNVPFDFNLKARIKSNEPDLTLMTGISGVLKFNLKQGTYDLKDLKISANPAVDNAETLQIVGDLNVQQKPMMVKGHLDVTQFNPGKLLKEIKIQLPPMADPKAMTQMAFKSSFTTDGKSFSAEKLDLTLDDFNIDGFFKIANLEKQDMTFQFKGNDLNLDRYLPPATEPAATKDEKSESKTEGVQSTEPPAVASGSAKELPLIPEDALRPLNIKGSLELTSLTVAKLTFNKPTVNLTALNGRQEIKLASGFYEGTIDLDGKLDVRKKGDPRIQTTADLKGINLQALAKPIPALKSIEGKVNADMNLTTNGQLQSVLTRNLNGKIDFKIDKGAFTEANFDKMVCEGIAKIRKKDLQKKDWGNATQFTNLGGSFNVRNGVASNKDLTAALTNLNLKGDGDINLVKQTLDYHVGLNISGDRSPDSDPACQVNEDYADVTWPVRCQGKLGQQECGIDTERLADTIASLAKQEVKKRLEKEIEKKAGPLKDALKGLFK